MEHSKCNLNTENGHNKNAINEDTELRYIRYHRLLVDHAVGGNDRSTSNRTILVKSSVEDANRVWFMLLDECIPKSWKSHCCMFFPADYFPLRSTGTKRTEKRLKNLRRSRWRHRRQRSM